VALVVLGVGLTAAVTAFVSATRPRSPHAGFRTTTVHRTNLKSEVLTSGRVQSSVNTEIRCGLEKLSAAGRAGRSTAGEASTILSLVPDGSHVKKDEILCTLDASDYEELVRQQKITVERAKADWYQASLALDVALIQLNAFLMAEQLLVTEPLKGQIALARADVTRQTDRLDWTRRMAGMGYSSLVQVSTEEYTLHRTRLGLADMAIAFRNYSKFTAPKQIATLENHVASAKSTYEFQSARLDREQERLAHYEKLVDLCTVRAPHDGFLIHANRPGRTLTVYLGAPVRERLRLFTLPDLSKMEIELLVHESVVSRIHPGMLAQVRIESLPGRELTGRVTFVSLFPLVDLKSETPTDITYFLGRVQLDSPPVGLRPGMSAEVTIETAGRRDVLAVPSSVVTLQNGHEHCYVVHKDHLELRPIKVGLRTAGALEITEGLTEGEEVLLDPSRVRSGSGSRLSLN
jgi:HlyD family secretion protein